ncbi:hypothetical protein [Bifidobacterium dentium]|nr:hypothetical protein [Bifidobacterium dentium]EDT45592.1 hypothetical protein BIFDEN_01426 [Bifidobacterium dentium ATCC 27678]BAQ27634.1 hypothetical protein BBDE_1640 [Bifidobacterium dentium JCM 1195 = DSM 20436]SEC44503.1 hypothetical protein SAMN05192536_1819 [Bifidobacterium dentium JCM 1195 = DSM 20436]VEG24305.1 Uncharacterised protein [Bifidobacterium dentium]
MDTRKIPFDGGMAATPEFVLITPVKGGKRLYKGVDVTNELYPSDDRRCMKELKRNMLEKDDPSEWLDGPACEFALRFAIAVCLRNSYVELIRKYRLDEPGDPTPSSNSVRELSRAFLGAGDAPRFDIMRTKAELDSRKAELDSKWAGHREELLAKALEMGRDLRTTEDIKKLSPDAMDMLLQIMDGGPRPEESRDDSDRDLFIPTPYVGYFIYRFLVPKEERANEKGRHPIAYWSTKQAWDHATIERLWDENDRDLKNWEFESFLEVSVNDFLYRANERASATSGLGELIRKRLSAARRERYEFIRVLAGEKDDPFIEQIRQVVDSGGKWDASKERRHGYRRKMTRWGNYGNPAEMSSLVAGDGSGIWKAIAADSRLSSKWEALTIYVGEKKPGGRMPNVGRKGSRELEKYLRFCFDVANGTLPMRPIIELVLKKCKKLRPLGSDSAESRRPVTMGRHSEVGAAALEMARFFRDSEEGE